MIGCYLAGDQAHQQAANQNFEFIIMQNLVAYAADFCCAARCRHKRSAACRHELA